MTKADGLLKNIQKFGYELAGASYRDEEQIKSGGFNYRAWRLPSENYKLQNTPFYLTNENDFIHFTSVETLYSIINEKHIRLYNLNNMEDKLEMEYANNELSFRQSIETSKEQLFSLSMCSANKIFKDKTKEHLLWKLYGRNGKGVIIRLSIENNVSQWYYYHLSKISYGLKNFHDIKKFNTSIHNEELDNKICCFIKSPIYKFENEIRLVFDTINPVTVTDKDNKKTYPIIFPDKLHMANNIFYFKLPLLNFHDKNDKIFLAPNLQGIDFELPKIRITEIILGYQYSDKDKENIKNKLSSTLTGINIKITDLKKNY